MGCDIHGVWQQWDNKAKAWEDIPSLYEQDRHYQLFAVLADVRNGYGFAGTSTGDTVVPISQPRGLPHDFTIDDNDCHPIASLDIMDPSCLKYHEKDEKLEVRMGDHSRSWLTGKEMLKWYASAPMVTHHGVVNKEQYKVWDRISRPAEYCGWTSGPGVKVKAEHVAVIDEPYAGDDWTHIQVSWPSHLGEKLAYFFDEVKRLVAEHGDIRFVFGFDS